MVLVSKGSKRKSVAIKLFEVSGLKTQQRWILQEEMKISKTEPSSVVDSLHDYVKTFDKPSKR